MRTTWLAVGLFLGASGAAHAQESLLHKLLSGPARPSAPVQAVGHTVAPPPVLPAVPVVVPPAGTHSRRLICSQTNTPSCCWDKVGFLRDFFTSGHAFFPMATGFGFCGLH
jgi:hypothetical protein